MAEDMDRIDAFTPFQIVSDLLQAILAAIEHDHFGAWCEAIDQLLLIGDLAIDEHHFLALIGCAVWAGTQALPWWAFLALAYVTAKLLPDSGWTQNWLAQQSCRMGRYSLEIFCLGVLLAPFHQTWPWSAQRWHFVHALMQPLCDEIVWLEAPPPDTSCCIDNPHLHAALPGWPNAALSADAVLWPDPGQRCRSFSRYWQVVNNESVPRRAHQ